MGSGSRLKFFRVPSFGIGAHVSRFPFAITLNFHVLVWVLSIGLGKGYDQPAE